MMYWTKLRTGGLFGLFWIHDVYLYPPWSCQAAPILRREECHADHLSAAQRMAAMLLAVAWLRSVWLGVLGHPGPAESTDTLWL